MSNENSQFWRAVKKCSALTLQDGKGALHEGKDKITTKKTRSITGSVNIDKCLKQSHSNAQRWDYVVGYRKDDGKEKAYFIEVHPAEATKHVDEVIGKAKFLNTWVACNAPELWSMPREMHWVASGKIDIRWTDSYRRQLALAGVALPQKYLELA